MSKLNLYVKVGTIRDTYKLLYFCVCDERVDVTKKNFWWRKHASLISGASSPILYLLH
jgi:hypothetical protein